VVPPGDPAALAEALAALAGAPSEALLQMGLNGRSYYQRNLAFRRGVQQTLHLLETTRLAS
jgi:glycosyltransferase involved in cell wall biosynthesis